MLALLFSQQPGIAHKAALPVAATAFGYFR
jgi:hypothetical protein